MPSSPVGLDVCAAYLAPEGLEQTLETALQRRGVEVSAWHGRLALSSDPPIVCPWSQDTWTTPFEQPILSIKSAAEILRARQRNWSNYAPKSTPGSMAGHHRRSALIGSRLPSVKAAALLFPEASPAAHLGAWTLLTPDRLLASPTKSSPFPNGECRFVEDHIGPPSRAYLKLWEALTRLGDRPGPGETCLDLGASPGGWTWVLAGLGASVVAVDKAPIAPALAALPNVVQVTESAFALAPRPVDWLVCDIIAYPSRTLGLLERWLPFVRNIVCTVKFQGKTDHETADRFQALPGIELTHLFYNKHELTAITRVG